MSQKLRTIFHNLIDKNHQAIPVAGYPDGSLQIHARDEGLGFSLSYTDAARSPATIDHKQFSASTAKTDEVRHTQDILPAMVRLPKDPATGQFYLGGDGFFNQVVRTSDFFRQDFKPGQDRGAALGLFRELLEAAVPGEAFDLKKLPEGLAPRTNMFRMALAPTDHLTAMQNFLQTVQTAVAADADLEVTEAIMLRAPALRIYLRDKANEGNLSLLTLALF